MMKMNLFQRVADAFRMRETQKLTGFEELVQAVVGGQDLPPADIAAQLEAFGRTPDDLQHAVEYRQRRLALAAEAAREPALRKELESVQSAYQVKVAEFEKVRDTYNKACAPLVEKAVDLERQVIAASGAVDKLREGYRGPLLDKLAEAERQRAEIEGQIIRARASLDHAERTLANYELLVSRDEYVTDETLRGARHIVKDRRRALEELLPQVDPFDAEIAELEKQMRLP